MLIKIIEREKLHSFSFFILEVIIIFDWLGDIISGMGDVIGNGFSSQYIMILLISLRKFQIWV